MAKSSPERKYVLGLEIGADDWQTVIRSLEDILLHIEKHPDGKVNLTSGSYSAGYTVIGKVNPDTTHDSYFKELHKWLEENRK